MPSVKIIQSVAHGRHNLHAGDVRDDLPQADINTLQDLGFVEPYAAEENLDDLVGGDKMDVDVQNKMQEAPANKGKK